MRIRTAVGQDLDQPVLEPVGDDRAQASRERAMRLGGIRSGVRAL